MEFGAERAASAALFLWENRRITKGHELDVLHGTLGKSWLE
jgi:hypothetical protein